MTFNLHDVSLAGLNPEICYWMLWRQGFLSIQGYTIYHKPAAHHNETNHERRYMWHLRATLTSNWHQQMTKAEIFLNCFYPELFTFHNLQTWSLVNIILAFIFKMAFSNEHSQKINNVTSLTRSAFFPQHFILNPMTSTVTTACLEHGFPKPANYRGSNMLRSVPCNSEWNKPITKRIMSLFAAWVFGWQRFWFQRVSFSPVRFNPNWYFFYHRRNYFKTGSLSTARPCQNKNDTISRVALIKSLRHDNTQKVLLDGPCGTLP